MGWVAMIGDCDKCGKHGEVYPGKKEDEAFCADCYNKQRRKAVVQIECEHVSDLLMLPDGSLAEAILNVCREKDPLDSASVKTRELFSGREILVEVSRMPTRRN